MDFTSMSLVEILKMLVNILVVLANEGNNGMQFGSASNSGNNTALNKSMANFSSDLYNKTVGFLKNNFKENDLLQISDQINWKELPKQVQNGGRSFR